MQPPVRPRKNRTTAQMGDAEGLEMDYLIAINILCDPWALFRGF